MDTNREFQKGPETRSNDDNKVQEGKQQERVWGPRQQKQRPGFTTRQVIVTPGQVKQGWASRKEKSSTRAGNPLQLAQSVTE